MPCNETETRRAVQRFEGESAGACGRICQTSKSVREFRPRA